MKRFHVPFTYTILYLFVVCLSFTAFAQTRSPKRGLSGDLTSNADLDSVYKGISWYYNWGITPNASIIANSQNYIEYVPMIWGGSFDKTTLTNYLDNHPEVKYILGFNEPNFKSEANLTPTQAAALWPQIEAIANTYHLKIVGPAMNYCGDCVSENGTTYKDPIKYLDDFFVACKGCRVDYIAIHSYYDYAPVITSDITKFSKYKKPIWLTEFNLSSQYASEEWQRQYLVDAVRILEKDTMLFRYSWFLTRIGTDGFPYTNILKQNQSGALSDLGLVYTNMSSFDSTYFHPVESVIEAEHYIDMSGMYLEKTTDTSGKISLYDIQSGEWSDYLIDIPETSVQYFTSFRYSSAQQASFSIYQGTTLLGSVVLPGTDGVNNWRTFISAIPLPSGKSKIRLKAVTGGFKLNSFKISSENITPVIDPLDIEAIKVYPNPVKDILTIEYASNLKKIQIIDVLGATLITGNSNKINVSTLSPGMYYVKINDSLVTKMYKE
ncbi:MAG: carbohydrate-binding protein [Cytophagales bacterium]|nr:carbohydrate-binding protein [Cytophaga sp.]